MSAPTSTYRQVFALPGAIAFTTAGVLARLEISMVSLGLVVLVSDRTGSYSLAGAISASYVGANAVVALPLARLVDRLGQGRVIGPSTTLSVFALALAMVAVEAEWALPLPHLLAAVSGATMPNIGAAVRARWTYVLPDRRLLDTAFAVESVNDEVVFIVGPTLITVLATAADPLAGLAAAGAAALVGSWALAVQRRTEPPPSPRVRGQSSAPMPWLALLPLISGAVFLGVVLGGCEVAVIALSDEQGHQGLAGILLAVWAAGSLLAGIVAGSRVPRRAPAVRYRIGFFALTVMMVPMPFVGSLWALGGLLFLAGFSIAPTMIAATSWVESLVPASRLNEGIAAFTTGLVAGVAPGAAIVGVVVDRHGASTSFWVPVAAGALGVVVGLLSSSVRRGPDPAGRGTLA